MSSIKDLHNNDYQNREADNYQNFPKSNVPTSIKEGWIAGTTIFEFKSTYHEDAANWVRNKLSQMGIAYTDLTVEDADHSDWPNDWVEVTVTAE